MERRSRGALEKRGKQEEENDHEDKKNCGGGGGSLVESEVYASLLY